MPTTDAESHLPLTNLAFHILLVLGSGPLHGYGIIKDIEARTDGRLHVRSGTLYTAIQRLLDDGVIAPAPAAGEPGDDSRRKYYRLTELGRRVARLEADRLAGLVAEARARRLAPDPGGG